MTVENTNQYFENFCPECGGNIICNGFERVCEKCGLVINSIFQISSYQFEENKKDGSSYKQYVALGNRTDFVGGLGSYIDYEKSKKLKDLKGNYLSPSGQRLFNRLKKNFRFSKIKNHETEYRIFKILKRVAINLNLTLNVRASAALFYKKIIKKDDDVINNITLIAFCIFMACKNFKAPISINEIAAEFKNLGHRVNPRLILRDGLKYKKHLDKTIRPPISEIYCSKLVNQVINHKSLKQRLILKKSPFPLLEYQVELRKICKKILDHLPLMERGGRNPYILMGAVIYLADKLLAKKYNYKSVLTQSIVAESTDIPEYSIRDHYVNLLKPLFN